MAVQDRAQLAAKGGIVIFTWHHLAKIEALCDEVTVFREGTDVGRGKLSEMPEEQLVELMLGRKLERVFAACRKWCRKRSGEWCARYPGFRPLRDLKGIDMEVAKGEIVGIGGLEGQGQAELFLSLFGVRRATGSITVNGRKVKMRSPADAVVAGIGLVPEDRATEGLCLPLGVRDNITLGDLKDVSRFGFMMNPKTPRANGGGPGGEHAANQSANAPAGSQLALGRQPAEGASGACADGESIASTDVRCHARGRRGHQDRDIPADARAVREGGWGILFLLDRRLRAGKYVPTACWCSTTV